MLDNYPTHIQHVQLCECHKEITLLLHYLMGNYIGPKLVAWWPFMAHKSPTSRPWLDVNNNKSLSLHCRIMMDLYLTKYTSKIMLHLYWALNTGVALQSNYSSSSSCLQLHWWLHFHHDLCTDRLNPVSLFILDAKLINSDFIYVHHRKLKDLTVILLTVKKSPNREPSSLRPSSSGYLSTQFTLFIGRQ